jgi:hypothetical protein
MNTTVNNTIFTIPNNTAGAFKVIGNYSVLPTVLTYNMTVAPNTTFGASAVLQLSDIFGNTFNPLVLHNHITVLPVLSAWLYQPD